MASKELVIDKEETTEIIEKGRDEIRVKILHVAGKIVVDTRAYYFDKDDENQAHPKPTSKGLWLDADTAMQVGMAMVAAAEKVLKK